MSSSTQRRLRPSSSRTKTTTITPRSAVSFWFVFFFVLLLQEQQQRHGIVVVQALCILENEQGIKVSTQHLPPGVTYLAGTDTLRCLTPQACRNWKIRGCTAVYCHGVQSCQEAHLIDNRGIACWSRHACQYAQFWSSHDISCGAGFEGSCAHVTIQTDAQVLCYGADACVRHKQINVGQTGHVRCANAAAGSDGTTTAAACHHLDVYLEHRHRACFGTDDEDEDGPVDCAVVCATPSDCDKETIQFIVQ
ncbi:hypothetical protein ACA910_011232 [Epithemia clementina (nom. ined.)]